MERGPPFRPVTADAAGDGRQRVTPLPLPRGEQVVDTAIVDTRKNHALEHATVAVLIETGVRTPLGGYSVPRGFVVWSRAPAEEMVEAARKALDLLRDGHNELAISPYCGTNIAAGLFIGGITASLLRGRRRGVLPNLVAATAALAAVSVLSRPLGELLQRKFTTLADAERMQIDSWRQLAAWPINVVWIRTEFLDA